MTVDVEQSRAKQTDRTFYSYIKDKPCSQVVHISGGEKIRDASTGKIIDTPMKEVRFQSGILHTSDPETIAVLEAHAKVAGCGITADKEEYLAHVMKPERLNERAKKILENKDKEIEELKAKLRGKATKEAAAQ